jgi:hypothetical protein
MESKGKVWRRRSSKGSPAGLVGRRAVPGETHQDEVGCSVQHRIALRPWMLYSDVVILRSR